MQTTAPAPRIAHPAFGLLDATVENIQIIPSDAILIDLVQTHGSSGPTLIPHPFYAFRHTGSTKPTSRNPRCPLFSVCLCARGRNLTYAVTKRVDGSPSPAHITFPHHIVSRVTHYPPHPNTWNAQADIPFSGPGRRHIFRGGMLWILLTAWLTWSFRGRWVQGRRGIEHRRGVLDDLGYRCGGIRVSMLGSWYRSQASPGMSERKQKRERKQQQQQHKDPYTRRGAHWMIAPVL